MHKLVAYQVGEDIDIHAFKKAFAIKPVHFNELEAFYQIDTERYVSVFKYGVVCFFNYEEKDINEFIKLLFLYFNCFFYDSELTKEYLIEANSKNTTYRYNKAEIESADHISIRLIMQSISKSVALDNYFQHARLLLEKTNSHVIILENEGKISISNMSLKQFIGETHSLKNKIIANIHLLDSDFEINQNPDLYCIDQGMKAALFLDKKSNNIYKELNIITEHLEGFRDIMTQGSNLKLAYIEIVLLGTFVIDIIVDHFFLK